MLGFGPSSAEPIDLRGLTHGIDCVGDSFNPIRSPASPAFPLQRSTVRALPVHAASFP